jgi:hypothetical protein
MNSTSQLQPLLQSERHLLSLVKTSRCVMVDIDKLELPEALYIEAALLPPLPQEVLLLPLLTVENDRSGYSIIDGCKRYVVLKADARPQCACGVLAGSLSGEQVGLLRILLNRGRTLHIREQFLFCKWLASVGGVTDPGATAHFLNLPWKQVLELRELLSFPSDVISVVLKDKIHLQNASDFRILPEEDRQAFLAFFEEFELSQQTEREFIQWLSEIALTRKRGSSEILNSAEYQAIRKDSQRNSPQKIQRIRLMLHSARYPEFDAAVKHWDILASEINPDPSAVTFAPAPFFEKDRLEIRVVVSQPRKAVDTFGKLSGISAETWSKLLGPV